MGGDDRPEIRIEGRTRGLPGERYRSSDGKRDSPRTIVVTTRRAFMSLLS